MDDRHAEQEVSGKDFWQWIPTGEFSLPTATIQTTFKTRALSLLDRHRNPPPEKQNEIVSKENLESLSSFLLDRIVPSIDWKTHARSLEPVLEPWCAAPGKRFILIQNVPHSGNAEILKHWAEKHGVRMIDPPHVSGLLKSGGDAWFKQFENNDSCWVLPDLEHCYLRHEAGLVLIRRFFDQLAAGCLGSGILGCSSWAWAFFHHALGVSAPQSMVTKPFDAETLRQWLGEMAYEKSHRQLRFRQSDNGREILSSEPEGTAAENSELPPFLRDLAAFSFGIPGVVLAYWRASLQTEPDTLDLEKNTDETTDGQSTIWVKPWMNVEKPGLPKQTGRHHAFILHSLLLHDSLDMDMLAKLLPVRHPQIGQALYDLSDNGVIECIDDRWRITPKGYPIVRGFLKNEGFLTDDFI